ncbi:MAG TPA: ABC transporter permease [Phycisphaerae bacterium]|nr:ABC transporter permease [Phycisphaerales bacterium]HRX84830.1 ABC transporter permease [Phycisphaerae bacterium]
MNGFWAILLKEFAHIRREPTTLFFAFLVPVLQLTIFGYAIDTTIEDITTVVYNLDGRRDSRDLVAAFASTRRFKVVAYVFNEADFNHALAAGRAKVGVKIPPDYTERLLDGEQAVVQVLIDGSDSQVATTALNSAALLGLNESRRRGMAFAEARQAAVARDPAGRVALPIEIRPRLLYNPNLESAHFFVPGLIGIIMQLVTLFLTSFAIVRERELGTLEQLFVTPVGRTGLMLGKLVPYAVIGFLETLIVLMVMVFVFSVPINGSLVLLLGLSLLFLLTALGLGLFISTLARTQLQAIQFAFMIMLPSILLSGFIFPREAMPLPMYLLGFFIPVTYFLEILRGIILRSAGLADLLPSVVGLVVCCAVVLTLSVSRFRKRQE